VLNQTIVYENSIVPSFGSLQSIPFKHLKKKDRKSVRLNFFHSFAEERGTSQCELVVPLEREKVASKWSEILYSLLAFRFIGSQFCSLGVELAHIGNCPFLLQKNGKKSDFRSFFFLSVCATLHEMMLTPFVNCILVQPDTIQFLTM